MANEVPYEDFMRDALAKLDVLDAHLKRLADLRAAAATVADALHEHERSVMNVLNTCMALQQELNPLVVTLQPIVARIVEHIDMHGGNGGDDADWWKHGGRPPNDQE